ncbi:NusG domain II-containing protein [bacterium]|nr:NusG domain II-containing protein [FCB group bacterium]MBL7190393.1 NusG domain II-containing protein [bacterium]
MDKIRRMKKPDWALMIGLILLSLTLMGWNLTRPQGGQAVVLLGSSVLRIIDLSIDSVYIIQGKISPVTLAVKCNSISVIESDCPLKLCVHRGAVKRTGESIICLPNNLAVYIKKGKYRGVDAAAG